MGRMVIYGFAVEVSVLLGEKYKTATKKWATSWHVYVVRSSWVFDSVQAGKCLEEEDYVVVPTAPAGISKRSTSAASRQHQKCSTPTNRSSTGVGEWSFRTWVVDGVGSHAVLLFSSTISVRRPEQYRYDRNNAGCCEFDGYVKCHHGNFGFTRQQLGDAVSSPAARSAGPERRRAVGSWRNDSGRCIGCQ